MASQTPAVMNVPTQPPPIVHAISGSIGSAVALVLLYPLERVRIELQRNAATSSEIDLHQSPTTLPAQSNCTKSDLRCPESFELVEEQEGAEILQERATSKASSDAAPTSLVRCIQDLWVKKSLYRGVMHNCISLSISNFCFFFVNEYVKKYLITMQRHHKGTSKLRPDEHLLASCIAGVCNVLVTNPLWVSNLQIVTEDDVKEGGTCQKGDQNTGVVSRLVHIARTQGVAHLWSGTAVSLLLVSNPVIQFFLYEQIKQRILVKGPLRVFFVAALAKFIATVVSGWRLLFSCRTRLPIPFLSSLYCIVHRSTHPMLACSSPVDVSLAVVTNRLETHRGEPLQ